MNFKRLSYKSRLILILLVAVAVISVIGFLTFLIIYNVKLGVYKEASDSYTLLSEDVVLKLGGKKAETEEENSEANTTGNIEIDWKSLKELYPDVLMWLYSEGTPINYPVFQGTDNDYYVNHLPSGKENPSGSIFLDCNTDFENDRHIVIYGHNMKDGSMFAELNKYATEGYYGEHKTMRLFTENKNYTLEVFAAFRQDVTYPFEIKTTFADSWEYQYYIDTCVGLSDFKADSLPTSQDRIITLCTCTDEHSDEYRYFVMCIIRDE